MHQEFIILCFPCSRNSLGIGKITVASPVWLPGVMKCSILVLCSMAAVSHIELWDMISTREMETILTFLQCWGLNQFYHWAVFLALYFILKKISWGVAKECLQLEILSQPPAQLVLQMYGTMLVQNVCSWWHDLWNILRSESKLESSIGRLFFFILTNWWWLKYWGSNLGPCACCASSIALSCVFNTRSTFSFHSLLLCFWDKVVLSCQSWSRACSLSAFYWPQCRL